MSAPADMDDREGLAAEYVLGTLPLADRQAAERLLRSDPDFALLVEAWQRRLSPLDAEFGEVAPPADLLGRIEARLFPAAATRPRWRLPLMGALAAMLVLLALTFWPAPPAAVTATLTGENQPLVVAASFDAGAGQLRFTRTGGPEADPGKDYELWVIPAGGSAVSLGVLRGGEVSVPLDSLPPGTTLAITLEQTGGSPTGVAQGPLLVAAVIEG